MLSSVNYCQNCGACCTNFRVSFYWAETDEAAGGLVPVALTEHVSPHLRCMTGTNTKPLRCIALEGDVGKQVSCSIYPLRSSTCREFDVFEPDGTPNPRCTSLRIGIGLDAVDISL